LLSPAPYSLSGRNRFHRPAARAFGFDLLDDRRRLPPIAVGNLTMKRRLVRVDVLVHERGQAPLEIEGSLGMLEAHGAHDSLFAWNWTRAEVAPVRSSIGRGSSCGCASGCPRAACRVSTSAREPTVAQFPGGHSNAHYLVRFAGADIVVRRPPFARWPPTAHDMAREFRWLVGDARGVFHLRRSRTSLCEDLDIIGSVFYAMERRRGIRRARRGARRSRASRGAAAP